MNRKSTLIEEITGTPMETITVGHVLNVFIGSGGEDEKQEIIDKGHAAGYSVTRNGVKTHHHFEAIVDAGQYIFDKSGNRVKGHLVEYTNQKDGSVTKRIIRTTYRNYDKL